MFPAEEAIHGLLIILVMDTAFGALSSVFPSSDAWQF